MTLHPRAPVLSSIWAALLGLTLVACTPAAPSASADIKVGSVMPLAGDQAAIARSYADGYRAYFGSVNDNGGITGRKLNWLIEDDGMQPARSIAGVRKLVQQDRVSLITGSYGTANTLQILPVVQELKIPLVAPIALSTALYRPVIPMVFTVLPGFADLFPAQTDYLKSSSSQRFAILYRNDAAGQEAVTGYSRGLDPSQIVAQVPYDLNLTDFTTLAERILAEKPDTVLMYGAASELAKAVEALRNSKFDGRISDSVSTADASFVKLAGPGVSLDGVLGQTVQDISGKAPGWATYTANLKKYSPDANPSSGFTATGYVNAMVVVETLKKAGADLSPEGIARAAESISGLDTGGLTGTISFSATKHLGADAFQVTEVKNGAVASITPFRTLPPP